MHMNGLCGGEAAAATFYPNDLVLAVPCGILDTADAEDLRRQEDQDLVAALHRAGTLQDLQAPLPVQLEAEEAAGERCWEYFVGWISPGSSSTHPHIPPPTAAAAHTFNSARRPTFLYGDSTVHLQLHTLGVHCG